jgi:hypothetical protein
VDLEAQHQQTGACHGVRDLHAGHEDGNGYRDVHGVMSPELASRCVELLSVWERWTDGDPSLRRLVGCASVDLRSHEERLRILLATTARLREHENSPGVTAALAAVRPCMLALLGAPDSRFEEAWQEAQHLHQAAEAGTPLTR